MLAKTSPLSLYFYRLGTRCASVSKIAVHPLYVQFTAVHQRRYRLSSALFFKLDRGYNKCPLAPVKPQEIGGQEFEFVKTIECKAGFSIPFTD